MRANDSTTAITLGVMKEWYCGLTDLVENACRIVEEVFLMRRLGDGMIK